MIAVVTNRTGGFAGRTGIWEERIRYLNREPHRWAVGSGFGSAAASGSQSHNFFLNVVLETGITGLLIAGLAMTEILRQLWKRERTHAIFWVSLVLLVTCLARETFYPVPHTAHFIGFYLTAVAIALRSGSDLRQSSGDRQ